MDLDRGQDILNTAPDAREGVRRLPPLFTERMEALLGEEWPSLEAALTSGARGRGLRVNTLKAPADCLEGKPGLSKVPWTRDGYYYEEDLQPGRSLLHEAGLYYIQEPSAMAVAAFSGVCPGERVLDLCAAPGGKTTALAAAMEGRGLLVSNEIHPARARILSQNVERMGIRNCLVTNETPDSLLARFTGFFDRVIVDAPCSGEGMFRKEDQALTEWSPENVRLCADRQRQILSAAAGMVRPGGSLVYSTCTFAPEEDEGQILAFLHDHPDFSLKDLPALLGDRMEALGLSAGRPSFADPGGEDPLSETLAGALRLWPHRLRGEGHFLAVLTREGRPLPARKRSRARGIGGEDEKLWKDFEGAFLRTVLPGTKIRFGDNLYLLPEDLDLAGLKVLRPGLHLGTIKKKRFEPAHALALSLRPGEAVLVRDLSASSPEAAAYFRGEALEGSGEKGWILVCLDGISAGWGKAGGSMIKNHLPRGLRKP